MAERSLAGLRVLIVEDESLVSMMIEDMLTDLGCGAVDVASESEEAVMKIASEAFDLAIVDVNLNGDRSFRVPETLLDRRVPFILSTGYGFSGLPAAFRGTPLIAKPFKLKDLAAALHAALDSCEAR